MGRQLDGWPMGQPVGVRVDHRTTESLGLWVRTNVFDSSKASLAQSVERETLRRWVVGSKLTGSVLRERGGGVGRAPDVGGGDAG